MLLKSGEFTLRSSLLVGKKLTLRLASGFQHTFNYSQYEAVCYLLSHQVMSFD
jgi:hypothetical protein